MSPCFDFHLDVECIFVSRHYLLVFALTRKLFNVEYRQVREEEGWFPERV